MKKILLSAVIALLLLSVLASSTLAAPVPAARQLLFKGSLQDIENHCIVPNGLDLNVLYGISKQIVTPFCNQVDSGEQWTAAGPAWFMNTSFEAVPDGFVSAGATPLEDFL